MIRKLLLLLLLVCGLWLLRETYFYLQVRQNLPVGTTIGGVDVSQLSPQEAGQALLERYGQPIGLVYQGERIDVSPADVGFALDLNGMLNQALQRQAQTQTWQGFVSYLLRRSLEPIQVSLAAVHDEARLQEAVSIAGELLGDPPVAPHVDAETESFVPGTSGIIVDAEATAQALRQALYDPNRQPITIPMRFQEAAPLNLAVLKQVLEEKLRAFAGYGSIFILDLTTGEELNINSDMAVSGTSILKIGILMETYRAMDGPPTAGEAKLIDETGIYSGNYSANLLLDIVAGQDNAYLGVDIMTESLHRLGLLNSFMVTPYEERERPEKLTLATAANTNGSINTYPDRSMQTTAEDMGSLLAMLYYCSQGGGPLLALYPGELTPQECQALLDVLAKNVEGNLIRFGVPEDVRVSHKHGWATNTHGDAGIVFSPGRDYVLVIYLTQPESDWLVAGYSFPLIRELSRITYNYFNPDAPYVGRPNADEVGTESAAEAESQDSATPTPVPEPALPTPTATDS